MDEKDEKMRPNASMDEKDEMDSSKLYTAPICQHIVTVKMDKSQS